MVLRKVYDEPQTVAYRLFKEAGITREHLREKIKSRETGDSN